MEEKLEEARDAESASNDSFIVDSDEDESSSSGEDHESHLEVICSRYLVLIGIICFTFVECKITHHALNTKQFGFLFLVSIILQQPLTEKEIEELIADFLEVESKVSHFFALSNYFPCYVLE